MNSTQETLRCTALECFGKPHKESLYNSLECITKSKTVFENQCKLHQRQDLLFRTTDHFNVASSRLVVVSCLVIKACRIFTCCLVIKACCWDDMQPLRNNEYEIHFFYYAFRNLTRRGSEGDGGIVYTAGEVTFLKYWRNISRVS